MPRRGTKSSPAMKRHNIKVSFGRLYQHLEDKFKEKAQLITLRYDMSRRPPCKALAEAQRNDWRRSAKENMGGEFTFIRATAWDETETGHPIHRFVVALDKDEAAALASYWTYGPTTVETVLPDKLEELARLLMGKCLENGEVAFPGERTWATSWSVAGEAKRKEKQQQKSTTASA